MNKETENRAGERRKRAIYESGHEDRGGWGGGCHVGYFFSVIKTNEKSTEGSASASAWRRRGVGAASAP